MKKKEKKSKESKEDEKIKIASELILIDFNKDNHRSFYNYKRVLKSWGEETWITNNELYCMKILKIIKDRMCSIHYHQIKDETFHIIDGNLGLQLWHNVDLVTFNSMNRKEIPDENIVLWPGSSIHIKPKTAHRFTGITNCQMIEVSTTHHEEDSIRLVLAPKYQ